MNSVSNEYQLYTYYVEMTMVAADAWNIVSIDGTDIERSVRLLCDYPNSLLIYSCQHYIPKLMMPLS